MVATDVHLSFNTALKMHGQMLQNKASVTLHLAERIECKYHWTVKRKSAVLFTI